jgi:hypothetical protein
MYAHDFNTDWKRAGLYLKKNVEKTDVILVSTLPEISTLLYHFSSSPGESLRYMNTSTYGRIIDNTSREVFYEKNNLLVGIRQNQGEGHAFIRQDFKEKVNRYVINYTCTYIWLAASQWTWEPDEEFMVSYMKKNFEFITVKKFNGVTIYKFRTTRVS